MADSIRAAQYAADSELFELAPVALQLEDFSGVYQLLESWRAQGVVDIAPFLRDNPQCISDYYAQLRCFRANRRMLELFEAPSIEALLAAASTIYARDDVLAPIAEIASFWRGERSFSSETINHTVTGKPILIRLNITVLQDDVRPWDRVLVAIEDFTEERHAKTTARENEAYARGLFDLSPVSLWVEDFSEVKGLLDEVRAQGITDFRTFVDVHTEFVTSCMERIRVIDVNQQTLTLFGAASKDELLGRLPDIFRDEMTRSFAEQLLDCWNGVLNQSRETLNYSLRGDPINLHMQWSVLPGHESTWDLVQVALTDISARKKAESYLEFLGKHDALTKLRNRAFYDDEITRLNRRGPFPVAVLTLDLNGLKKVNDQLGHSNGDALLRRAGEALKKALGDGVQPARVGGDEFVCLIPRCSGSDVAALKESLRAVVDLNNQFYQGARLSMAVGSAVCEKAGELDRALREADDAMYAAKRAHYAALGGERRGPNA